MPHQNEFVPERHRLIKHTMTPKYAQSASPLASGNVDVVELGRMSWMLDFETTRLSDTELAAWEAWMARREQGKNSFLYTPLHRPRPIGVAPDVVQPVFTLLGIGEHENTGRWLACSPNNADFQAEAGSYISFNTDTGVFLGTVVKTNHGGGSARFHISPQQFPRPSAIVANRDIRLVNPVMRCRIMPDSYDPEMTYRTHKIAFKAYQIHGGGNA